MNVAVLSGVKNWPNCDFLFAEVLFESWTLFISTADNNGRSPVLCLDALSEALKLHFHGITNPGLKQKIAPFPNLARPNKSRYLAFIPFPPRDNRRPIQPFAVPKAM